jgi:transposase
LSCRAATPPCPAALQHRRDGLQHRRDGLHLAKIAPTVTPGAHAGLLLDQAGWHLSDKRDIPSNITLMPVPPKSPELNPVENIWQFIRDNWLSNRVCRSYDDILDHCCHAWNKLADQPWTVMSIALRDCAHRF